MKAMDLIEKYGLSDTEAIYAMTYFLDDYLAREELCQVIDKYEATEGFATCLREIFPEPSDVVGDEEFLRQLETMETRPHDAATEIRQVQTSVPRAKRVHVKEMDRVQDSQGGYRATNGGLYEIVIHPTDGKNEKSVSVVSSSQRAGTAEDLRLLRNLISDLEGHVFPIHHEHDRLAFWKWKAAVIQKIFEHPAMRADAEPVVVPHFDGLQWEEDFLSGMSVDEAVDRADAAFNRGGW